MSSGVDRPAIWSYFSFSRSASSSSTRLSGTTRRRASSSLLPRREHSASRNISDSDDPFEKHARHQNGPASFGAAVGSAGLYERSSSAGGSRSASASGFGAAAFAERMPGGRHLGRFLRVGGLLAAIVLLLLYLAPDERRARVEQYVDVHNPLHHSPATAKTPSIPIDPSITTPKCTKPHSPSKPLVQYALMIDAGSTGSRIHVYRFNNCGATPELESEVFEQTAQKEGGSGLSSYKSDAEGAAKSLDVLLEVAMKNVPEKIRGCTPIAVKATAGLRKLGPEMSDAILKAVRKRLETMYPFPLVSEEKGGVEVMDGKDEGVYAWITANYLLGRIGGPEKSPTAAVFDLGGGSTQIVFEPTFKGAKDGGMPGKMEEGDHKYELSFGGRKFSLYQHSYLGYGLMAAREALHKLVLDAAVEENKGSVDASWLKRGITNPCIVPGMSRDVVIELGPKHVLGVEAVTVKMVGPSEGSATQCRAVAEKALRKDAECKLAPCAFNGVHQPSMAATFAREDVYLFSYFYDRTSELGMPSSFTIRELKDLAQRVCDGEKKGGWDVFASVPGALEGLKGRPESCLDLSFMVGLLHEGYGMGLEREVKIAKKIGGNELGWCLGASLPLLERRSGWECKIQEVTL